MAYIGKSIESGTFSVLDTSGNTYNGSNVTFNLGTQVGSPAQLLVSHDGVIQKPGTDYSLATGGTQITFSTAPASGASIFIVEISGAVGGPLDSDLNGTELILDADADTSITADTDDQIDVKIAGADDFTITANKFDALAGSNIHVSGDADADDITGDSAQGRVTIGAGQDLNLYHGGTNSYIVNDTGNLVVNAGASDADIAFSGNDGGSAITALTLDMSAGGDLTLGANANIVFPATNVVSTNANTLDDYEEGNFTPTVTANSVAYDNRTGRYTKVGNKVFVECLVQWNSASFASATGKLTVTGLPFTPIVIHYHGTYGTAYISSVNTNNTDGVAVLNVIATANDSSAVELIVYNNDAGGSYVKNDNNGDGVFSFCITYRTTA
jgi:hypothetical protein